MHNWAKCLAISKKNVVKCCRNAVFLSLFVCKNIWLCGLLYVALLHNAVKNIVNPSVKKNYLFDKLLVSNLVMCAKSNMPCCLCQTLRR